MLQAFHAYQGECESAPLFYKCQIADKHFILRLADLSLEMGVLSFLDEKRTRIDIPKDVRFWLFEDPQSVKLQKPYKRGFIYDKKKEYSLEYHHNIFFTLPHSLPSAISIDKHSL